ncbi:TIGR00730 family Rossman fold protein [Arenicella sp. 4NH20-0111]|uniref:LOG family protein n=1 Tax=Arenicella sp. 4NH20-0111 TaxID=3127648 RepID=UPI003105F6DE
MKTVCVYCGSSEGVRSSYMSAATSLGQALVENKLDLVYGGADVGLMGATANAVLENGGSVTGIIPKALFEKEVAHQGLSELRVVADMHERKSQMAEMGDGFITLPGGLGTLEELFEMLTWSQLGFHDKPIGVLNVDGYFDSLLQFIDNSIEQGFINASHRDLFCVSSSPEELVSKMQCHKTSKHTI